MNFSEMKAAGRYVSEVVRQSCPECRLVAALKRGDGWAVFAWPVSPGVAGATQASAAEGARLETIYNAEVDERSRGVRPAWYRRRDADGVAVFYVREEPAAAVVPLSLAKSASEPVVNRTIEAQAAFAGELLSLAESCRELAAKLDSFARKLGA